MSKKILDKKDTSPVPTHLKNMKKKAYKDELTNIRVDMSKTNRLLSRIFHLSIVEKTTNYLSELIFKPSNFLVGMSVALIGTALSGYYSRTYGFRMSFLLPILLFGAGFVISGLVNIACKILK